MAETVDCDFRSAQFMDAKLAGASITDSRHDWPIPLADEDLWYCGGGLIDAHLDGADINSAVIRVRVS